MTKRIIGLLIFVLFFLAGCSPAEAEKTAEQPKAPEAEVMMATENTDLSPSLMMVNPTPTENVETGVLVRKVERESIVGQRTATSDNPSRQIFFLLKKFPVESKDHVELPANTPIYAEPAADSNVIYITPTSAILVWDTNRIEGDENGSLWVGVVTPDGQNGWLKIE